MKVWQRLKAGSILAITVGAVQVVLVANGVAIPSGPSNAAPAMTPESMAVDAYNSGIRHRDRAIKADSEALKQKKPEDRLKREKTAREEYGKALKDFQKAAELNPGLPQAFNGMGYSYRKLGDFEKALASYDQALKLNPRFLDAIEYRAEAYLGLHRIEDAKAAYLTLFGMDRKQAETLMAAMREYVAKKKTDPAGVDAAALSAFEAWIAERAAVADQTRQMALNVRSASWR
jgi:tetratricopeptide (TPR) repeat protein